MTLIKELKRRNIFRTALLYVISAWLILQVGDLLFDLMGLPDFALRIALGILLLGFPLVLGFTWAYEITPEGIRKDAEVQRSDASIAETSNKLNVAVIVVALAALAVLALDRFYLPEPATRVAPQTAETEDAAPPA